MSKAHFNFGDFSLSYDLTENPVVDIWKSLVSKAPLSSMCSVNHKIGFEAPEETFAKADRLYSLAEQINVFIPNGIQLIKLTESNWKEALNKLHVHFPLLRYNYPMSQEEFELKLLPLLEEYNDLIHWLEKAYDKLYGTKVNMSAIYCDFNKGSLLEMVEIPDDGYKLFTPLIDFGTLHIHYAHVGRHPFELLTARDYDCPKDQALSQHKLSASCAMYFNDRDFYRQQLFGQDVDHLQKIKEAFVSFYEKRGGQDFFGWAFDDPRLAFGYMKIGQLENIGLFGSLEARNELREKLATAKLESITIS